MKIMDRLTEYYNAASGEKAEEIRKRTEAMLLSIQQGQQLNYDLLEKLDQRSLRISSMKEDKMEEIKKINDQSELVKYKVYEQEQQRQYNVLQKICSKDRKTVDYIGKTNIETKKKTSTKKE